MLHLGKSEFLSSNTAADVADTGIIVTMISPGCVNTRLMRDSGWTGKSISAEKSAGLVIALIERLEPEMKSRLVIFNGAIVPW